MTTCGYRLCSIVAIMLSISATANAAISITQVNGSHWNISNGDLSIVFDPASNNITSASIGSSGNLLNPNNSQMYDEFAGTPFGSGTNTSGYQQGSNYIDFWTTTASNPTLNSSGNPTNPITYSIHYVMFNNDPDIVCYEVLNHSATDPATSVGQGQFIARFNTSMFNQSYQYNVSVNNLGAQTATIPPTYPADGTPNLNTVSAQAGRVVTDSTTDLTGSGLAGDWGTNINTKYDFISYYQLLQADTIYGSSYAVSNIYTSMDTINGGPTHQDLMSTNLALIGFLSGHEGDPNYAYVPTQGANTTRLFGPFAFRFVPTNGESGGQLYQDAVNSMPTLTADYDTDQELIASGYVPTSQRGSMQISAGNSAGWSSNVLNNTVVLSDPNKSFQESNNGYQYWAQLSSSGAATISNIVPGTYRLSLYLLGQWGETRVDGVVVKNGQISIPQNLKFTPENFGTAPPIWTIGTPDRSAHEFLNGHNTSATNGVTPGGDLHEYYGAYDYWAEEQALGNPGKVVYYATAVGSTPATNNPNAWIANQWGKFDPGLYDPTNGTSDNYNNVAPAYVLNAGGPASYSGSPWEVHFATTTTQRNQGQYVVLSVGLAAVEGSLTVALNGHSETWHFGGASGTPISVASDAMVRSGVSGTYQFLAYQFPTSDLISSDSGDNVFTFSVSQTDGDMYDALRMEITNTSAAPSVTGWNDYEYIYGSNSQIDADNTVGLTASEVFVPEPPAAMLAMLCAGLLSLSLATRHWLNRSTKLTTAIILK